GDCDLEETCTGSSATCPADGVASSGTVCRSAAGLCDAVEVCNGSATTCPADSKLNGTICNPIAGNCDVAETCDGSSNFCPDTVFLGAGTRCPSPHGVRGLA